MSIRPESRSLTARWPRSISGETNSMANGTIASCRERPSCTVNFLTVPKAKVDRLHRAVLRIHHHYRRALRKGHPNLAAIRSHGYRAGGARAETEGPGHLSARRVDHIERGASGRVGGGPVWRKRDGSDTFDRQRTGDGVLSGVENRECRASGDVQELARGRRRHGAEGFYLGRRDHFQCGSVHHIEENRRRTTE